MKKKKDPTSLTFSQGDALSYNIDQSSAVKTPARVNLISLEILCKFIVQFPPSAY